DQLIDETKVYEYWPYHTAWLQYAEIESDLSTALLTESLVSVVAGWARGNPGLAAAMDHAPPICAVEDLLAVNRGRLSAVRAHAILVNTVRQAVESPATLPDDAVDAARAELGTGERRGSSPDALVLGLAEQIYAITRATQCLPADDAAAVWRAATDLMRDV